jgi:TatD DNase family protein
VIIDSHCHLDDAVFDDDRDAVVERAREAGVDLMLAIGTGDGPPDLEVAIRLAEQYDSVRATVGIHPHDARKADAASFDRLAELCGHPRVLALGEIGLDYHYDNSPREIQREVFVNQMQIARQAGKPIVIHSRDAWEDTIELLETHWRPGGLGGIMHCFSGGVEQAREALDLGFWISFAGVVTFPRAEQLREAAAAVPLDRLLVETDAPYLTPEPYRKIRRNEPRYVVETARKVAAARGMEYEELAAATSRNFCALFDLPAPC